MQEIRYKVINGYKLKKKEALEIYRTTDTRELCQMADEVRQFFKGDKIELCTIMNAKSGKCSEDCKYCAQSAYYSTGVAEYPLISKEEAIERAKENIKYGVNRFSLVTSGKGISEKELDNIIDIYKELKNRFPDLNLCASHGIITYEQAVKLKEAGVDRYHHNLETSKRLYEKICTTHTYNDRVNTIKNAQKAGLSVCSGGIIGLGENVFDRINMAFELRKLDIDSVPINILCPVKGTPLEEEEALDTETICRAIAMFRIILPKANIRFAGGRIALGDYQEQGFKSGISATMVGNYLTTIGNNIQEDIEMINKIGFTIKD